MIRFLVFVAAASSCLAAMGGNAPYVAPQAAIAPQAVVINGQQYYISVPQPVVLQQVLPATYYSPGAELKEAALVERLKRALLADVGQAESQPLVAEEPVAEAPPAKPSAIQRCVKCHEEGGGGHDDFAMPSLEALDCDQRLEAIRAVLDGSMPKGAPLTAEELGETILELASPPQKAHAETRSDEPVVKPAALAEPDLSMGSMLSIETGNAKLRYNTSTKEWESWEGGKWVTAVSAGELPEPPKQPLPEFKN